VKYARFLLMLPVILAVAFVAGGCAFLLAVRGGTDLLASILDE
jgi:hypothetical protein